MTPRNIEHNAGLVTAHLRHGHANAIKGRDLRQVTGLLDRDLRLALEHLRRSGAVVVSGNEGYYLPETLAEVTAYIKQEEHRNGNHWKTLESARRLAEEMRGHDDSTGQG